MHSKSHCRFLLGLVVIYDFLEKGAILSRKRRTCKDCSGDLTQTNVETCKRIYSYKCRPFEPSCLGFLSIMLVCLLLVSASFSGFWYKKIARKVRFFFGTVSRSIEYCTQHLGLAENSAKCRQRMSHVVKPTP